MQTERSEQYIEEIHEAAVIYQISGEFARGRDYDRFEQDIQSDLLAGFHHVIVDLGGVYYVNSSGIGALLELHEAIKKAGASLTIVNLQHAVAEIFLNMNLFKLFKHYDTTKSALSHVAQ